MMLHCKTWPCLLPVAAVLILGLGACQALPLKLAFIGPQSGINSSLGVEGRLGFEIGLRSLDWQGHTLDIAYYDDQGQAESAVSAVDDALAKGIRLFIFQTTSGAGKPAVERALAAGAFCFSSTISDASLSGKKDWFFRTTLPNALYGTWLARMILEAGAGDSILVFGDLSNKNYVSSVFESLKLALPANAQASLVSFDPSKDFKPDQIVKQRTVAAPQSVVLIANPINSALLSQELRKAGLTSKLFLAPWGVNDEYIANSGRSGEGATALSLVRLNTDNPSFISFSASYREASGKEPSYYAQYGYESAWVLQQALTGMASPTPQSLADFFGQRREFQGLVRELVLDEYGDGTAEPIIYQVKDGAFRLP